MSNPVKQINTALHQARLARSETGKSIPRQIAEIRRLARCAGQCGASDYYELGLYNDGHLAGNRREDFVGWRGLNEFSLALNPRHSVLPAWDKFVFTQLALGSGLPAIPPVACVHPGRSIPAAFGTHLRDASEVRAFLCDRRNYPLFGKPAFSQQGIGACYLTDYVEGSGTIRLKSGEQLGVDQFVNNLFVPIDPQYHRPECGYLFQQPLEMPDTLQRLTGTDVISGLRVVCLNDPQGAFPIAAIWKVAVPPNQVDNFNMGKYGNLVASIDVQSGKLGPLIGQCWPGAQLHDVHPASNQPVAGTVLPYWADVLRICEDAGKVFPVMKIHHWDIVITSSGPRLLELNDQGALAFLQLHGKGLLTARVRSFFHQHANATRFPWVNSL